MGRRVRVVTEGVYVWLPMRSGPPHGETWYWTNSYEHTRMDMGWKAMKREARRKRAGVYGS